MAYDTRIILDSVTPAGARLTTFQFTLPRIVLAELNTHKMLSKGSASSRAIPVEKQIARVESDPFIPFYFGKNQKGMQAESPLDKENEEAAELAWRSLIKSSLDYARFFAKIGLHKQLANRVLETVNWHTVIVTGTEYENYFALRDNPAAAPEIRESAHQGQELWKKNEPILVKEGDWHLPYVTGFDIGKIRWDIKELLAMSAGRCAAVSYLNQDNELDPAGDIKRTWEKLIPNGHMSPTEHQAQSLTWMQWVEHSGRAARDWTYYRVPVGNLWGWKQWRKTLKNEHNFRLHQKEESEKKE
jgi:thymidylate synthase ThyX